MSLSRGIPSLARYASTSAARAQHKVVVIGAGEPIRLNPGSPLISRCRRSGRRKPGLQLAQVAGPCAERRRYRHCRRKCRLLRDFQASADTSPTRTMITSLAGLSSDRVLPKRPITVDLSLRSFLLTSLRSKPRLRASSREQTRSYSMTVRRLATST